MSSDPIVVHPRHKGIVVEALVQGLEGGGDNGGSIPGMCNDLLLVTSHFDPNFFLSHFGR